MQIVYITHHSFLHTHAFSGPISWLIVAGSGYGLLRLIMDGLNLFTRDKSKPQPSDSRSDG